MQTATVPERAYLDQAGEPRVRPTGRGHAAGGDARATSDIGTRLSTLWVVVMFNMVFADILTFIKPGALQELWAGQAGPEITQGLLLGFAILIEVPIVMIFLSRVLKPAANRRANTVAAVVTTAFVVAGGSMDLHYIFFASAEIACMALIVWSVWARRDAEVLSARSSTRAVTGEA